MKKISSTKKVFVRNTYIICINSKLNEFKNKILAILLKEKLDFINRLITHIRKSTIKLTNSSHRIITIQNLGIASYRESVRKSHRKQISNADTTSNNRSISNTVIMKTQDISESESYLDMQGMLVKESSINLPLCLNKDTPWNIEREVNFPLSNKFNDLINTPKFNPKRMNNTIQPVFSKNNSMTSINDISQIFNSGDCSDSSRLKKYTKLSQSMDFIVVQNSQQIKESTVQEFMKSSLSKINPVKKKLNYSNAKSNDDLSTVSIRANNCLSIYSTIINPSYRSQIQNTLKQFCDILTDLTKKRKILYFSYFKTIHTISTYTNKYKIYGLRILSKFVKKRIYFYRIKFFHRSKYKY